MVRPDLPAGPVTRAGDLAMLGQVAPDLLTGIVAAASDITIMLDGDSVIRSILVNDTSPDFGKLDHWVGRPARTFMTTESVPKFDAMIGQVRTGAAPSKGVELNHRDNAIWDFPIRYTFHALDGDGQVLMLGRDLRPIAETQQQLVQAQLALERGYEAQRESDSRYRLLLATVTDAVVMVSLGEGRVLDANDHAAAAFAMPRKDLVGAGFAGLFADMRRGDMETRLVNAGSSDPGAPIALRTQRTGRALRVIPSVFRIGADRIAICRLESDGAPGAAAEANSLSARLTTLYDTAVEAIVFTDLQGTITTANDRFLGFADITHLSDLPGRSLGDFLIRGQVDLNVLLDHVGQSGRVRLYATELTGDYGGRTQVEVSATRVVGGAAPQIAFVIRDTGRLEGMRPKAPETESAHQRNVQDLVGSAALKDIVAETSDVIEKMCIETAIRLTGNNRAASAEMLGLSRQSLYVKLRKYDLARKGDDD